MPDDRDKPNEEDAPRRVSPIGLVLAGLAALLFVGGTLVSVLTAEDAEVEDEQPRPTLSVLLAETDVVVRGTSEDITRLGEPRDAGVLAHIDVNEVIVERARGETGAAYSKLTDMRIYDRDFRESWVQGQEMVLFLTASDSLPEDAKFRVQERCVLEEGALPCPYDMDEVRLGGNGSPRPSASGSSTARSGYAAAAAAVASARSG